MASCKNDFLCTLVRQRYWWILVYMRSIGSFHAPWFNWFWIIYPHAVNPKECRVLSLEQRSLTERTISALAKGKSYTFVGQGQNEEACIELKLRLLSVNWYDFNTLTHQLYNVFTCDSREGHSPLPRLSNSGWTTATKQNGSWSSRQVCELWGVCWSHLQDCYWYPVVNDENVDSPSLAISDIPIYLLSWLPLLFIFSFIPISLHLKLCHQVIDNNVFEE